MLTISSISVSPWPQQAPTVKAQPASATKSSDAVSNDSAGAAASAGGDSGAVQAAYAPRALPPVDPSAEAASVDLPPNAAVPDEARSVVESALAQRQAVQQVVQQQGQAAAEAVESSKAQTARFRGELPVDIKYPEQIALETQINDLVPNLWKASGAAVDVLIGEDALAAAAARAEVLAQLSEVADAAAMAEQQVDAYSAQAAQNSGTAPGSVLSESA